MNILCIGLGSIGKAVANTLAENGHAVTGVSRSAKQGLAASMVHVQADVLTHAFAEKLAGLNTHWHKVIITLTPSDYTDAGYQQAYVSTAQAIIHTLQAQQHAQPPQVFFISSTGVYGENAGECCNELTPAKPIHARAKNILQAEELYQAHFEKVTVIRPSGIYGLQRLWLLNMLDSGKSVPAKHWTNRIFDTDLVNVIVQIVQLAAAKPVYIATDGVPVYQAEVLDYLAKKLAKPALEKITLAKTAMLNDQSTGKQLTSLYLNPSWLSFPNWQAGYDTVINNLTKATL